MTYSDYPDCTQELVFQLFLHFQWTVWNTAVYHNMHRITVYRDAYLSQYAALWLRYFFQMKHKKNYILQITLNTSWCCYLRPVLIFTEQHLNATQWNSIQPSSQMKESNKIWSYDKRGADNSHAKFFKQENWFSCLGNFNRIKWLDQDQVSKRSLMLVFGHFLLTAQP